MTMMTMTVMRTTLFSNMKNAFIFIISFNPSTIYEVKMILALQMRKLRLGVINFLAQCHTVGEEQCLGSNPSLKTVL